MDIAALGTEMSQMKLHTQVGVAVARKAMDAQRQQGDAAIALLQAATEMQDQMAPGLNAYGGTLDVRG